MEFVVEPWHWFVLGILLILSELILPAFAALWFGIAAIMVCFLLVISRYQPYYSNSAVDCVIGAMYPSLVQIY